MLTVTSLKVLNLEPFSLAVEAGDCVVIGGPSGSGKSLILRAVADLEPSSGTVSLDGVDRNAMSGPEWRKLVRYVGAEPGWWGDIPLTHFAEESYANDKALQLGLEADILERPIARLSTGERQRLAFARALEDRPKVLLLDEPTGALDGLATARMESLIDAALQRGVHILLVTHDPEQAARLASRTFTIRNGRLEADA